MPMGTTILSPLLLLLPDVSLRLPACTGFASVGALQLQLQLLVRRLRNSILAGPTGGWFNPVH